MPHKQSEFWIRIGQSKKKRSLSAQPPAHSIKSRFSFWNWHICDGFAQILKGRVDK